MRILRVERERAESNFKRSLKRKKAKLRKIGVGVLLLLLGVGLLRWGMDRWREFEDFQAKQVAKEAEEEKVYVLRAPLIDEGRSGVGERMKSYAGRLERDLADLGFVVEKIIVPKGKIKELDVYGEGLRFYIKTSMIRGTAETAEDTMRMLKYLEEQKIEVGEYIDVRVEGRGYYK